MSRKQGNLFGPMAAMRTTRTVEERVSYVQSPRPEAGVVPSMVEGELRIRDIDLAERLGFAAPIDIRKLIRRYEAELRRMGVLATVAKTSGNKGGRPGTEYYLNRKQAIFITAKSETANAIDITIEIIRRFDAYERGVMSVPAIAGPVMIGDINSYGRGTVGGITKAIIHKALRDIVLTELAADRSALLGALQRHGLAVPPDQFRELYRPMRTLLREKGITPRRGLVARMSTKARAWCERRWPGGVMVEDRDGRGLRLFHQEAWAAFVADEGAATLTEQDAAAPM